MLDLNTLEHTLQLLKKYQVTELQCEEFTIKLQSTSLPNVQLLAAQDDLAKHLEPLPNEPWMSINDEALQHYSITGKV